jgi:hypothetical protein
MAARESGKNGAQGEYDRLVQLTRENRYAFVSVEELRIITRIGEKQMIHLRKVAAKDDKSDPWYGGQDLTSVEKFWEWYWGPRRQLEKKY